MTTTNTIFLIGYMGSGKSTLGKKLASRLGIAFFDLDQLIIEQISLSIPDFFERYGEEAFREKESEVLRNVDTAVLQVVAVGGGTPCFYDNMQWMNDHGKTIYLQLSAKALWTRLDRSDVSKRPVLQGLKGDELLDFVSEKLQEREPYYLQAQYAIDQMRTPIHRIIEECALG